MARAVLEPDDVTFRRGRIFIRRAPDTPAGGRYFWPDGAWAFESFGFFCLLAS